MAGEVQGGSGLREWGVWTEAPADLTSSQTCCLGSTQKAISAQRPQTVNPKPVNLKRNAQGAGRVLSKSQLGIGTPASRNHHAMFGAQGLRGRDDSLLPDCFQPFPGLSWPTLQFMIEALQQSLSNETLKELRLSFINSTEPKWSR